MNKLRPRFRVRELRTASPARVLKCRTTAPLNTGFAVPYWTESYHEWRTETSLDHCTSDKGASDRIKNSLQLPLQMLIHCCQPTSILKAIQRCCKTTSWAGHALLTMVMQLAPSLSARNARPIIPANA